VRKLASGRILLVEQPEGGGEELRQLLCDLLARSLEREHTYALYLGAGEAEADIAAQAGFLPIPGQGDLLYADMRSPLVLIEDALQRIKEPFASDEAVVAAVLSTRPSLRRAIANLFPGKLLLCFDMEAINAGLIEKVRARNGVADVPPAEKRYGKFMCVPYGKILADTIVPNTVTKALHADKVFHADESGFDITESPGYSLLVNQVKTLKSFRRPVLLIDDCCITATGSKSSTRCSGRKAWRLSASSWVFSPGAALTSCVSRTAKWTANTLSRTCSTGLRRACCFRSLAGTAFPAKSATGTIRRAST
jgi:hypothetical protein